MGARGFRFALATAVGVVALLPATAQGTVTIGSNLNRIPTASFAGTNTLLNSEMPASYQAPGGLTSPVNGTVTLWRLLSASSGTAAFQVVHPLGGNLFTGGGTTLTAVVPGNTVSTYPLSMPIKLGDFIAVVADSGLKIDALTAGAHFLQWQPPLQDGGPGSMPVVEGPGNEITANAEIAPTNTFTLTAIDRDKKRGKATLTVVVSNPGAISGSGKGVKVSSAAGPGKSVSAPGPVPLVVKATGKQGKTLNQTGKVKLRVTLSFTPTGGAASSQTVKVKLKKKL
jgi:hypothetical protein